MFLVSCFVFSAQEKIEIEKGDFQPSYKSLQNYQCPDWFRDAKFGIIAHYGPQCAPEYGDWYAKKMYEQYDKHLRAGKSYNYHFKNYGHPSEFGFKDVINTWKAEKWDPEALVKLYKKAGAKYFIAMANHHDNFDMYNSKYQEWNSVNMGPKKDLIAGWKKAAINHGLRFGVSNHSSHAWHWYQRAYAYDVDGPMKGVRYDGFATKKDGKGKWWEGYDPQELYPGNHFAPPAGFETKEEMDNWFKTNDSWFETIPPKDNGYALKWFLRCKDLVDKYKPDILYFDDYGLPLEQYGLSMASHFYNSNKKWHNGKLEGVINAKHMDSVKRKSVVLDIERKKSNLLDLVPWQTDDCIGDWHYRKNQNYKSVGYVIKNLVDIVSKNGNLLLSIPIKSDGSLDAYEIQFLKDLGHWFDVFGEAIYNTRPWHIYGEGKEEKNTTTTMAADGEIKQKKAKPLSVDDVRFTTKDGTLFAFVLGKPKGVINIKALGLKPELSSRIQSVKQVGVKQKVKWKQLDNMLVIEAPKYVVSEYTTAFKITFKD
ncbi:alpha-L-fucosidase [Postechiella marina]|uniref:alpha-L-fucosidase n=2 Tax=Postechiella marina TaxID=943941 RepID=A0ABP8CDK8_9FLAO